MVTVQFPSNFRLSWTDLTETHSRRLNAFRYPLEWANQRSG